MTRKHKYNPPELTQAYLRQRFRYWPITGRFTRLNLHLHRSGTSLYADTSLSVGYPSIHLFGRNYLAHRLAWLYMYGQFPPKGMEIDHINGDRTDNRLSNLRLATHQQNIYNIGLRSNNTSGFMGVFRGRGGRWISQIQSTVNGEKLVRYLGTFETKEEAAEAYSKSALELRGEFARLE